MLFVALCLLLSACLPEEDAEIGPEEITVTAYTVGGVTLHVPDVYTKAKGTSVGAETGFIQTFYPGSNPIPGDPQELWEQGEWYKNINILFQHADPSRAQAVLDGFIKSKHASKDAGSKYGLQHLTQGDEEQWFRDDIWIEDRENGSFISCAEKQYEPANPQCSHYLFSGSFFLKITYSKKFLPDWKLIKGNALGLFESFKSREAATAYVQQLSKETDIEGDKP